MQIPLSAVCIERQRLEALRQAGRRGLPADRVGDMRPVACTRLCCTALWPNGCKTDRIAPRSGWKSHRS